MKRRSFLAAGAGAISSLLTPISISSERRSVVAVISHSGISTLSGKQRIDAFHAMVKRGVSLLGTDAFSTALHTRRSVSLKANCLAGRPLSPDPELAEALGRVLTEAGVRDVSVWDRSQREMIRAGYSAETTSGITCTATDARGVGYSRRIHEHGRVGSLLSNVLLEHDGLVSLGVLKDHDLSGISCAMKNLFGIIHNPNKYHDDGCDPFVAHVTAMPAIHQRLFLSVVDATVAQCHGGPAYSPAWTWNAESIMLSLDPVALDTVALKLIEEQRASKGLKQLAEEERHPRWLETAESLGLGTARLERIDIREDTI